MKMQSAEMIENNISHRGKCLSSFCLLMEETELGDPLIEGPQAVKFFILKPTLTTLCAHRTHLEKKIINTPCLHAARSFLATSTYMYMHNSPTALSRWDMYMYIVAQL